MQALSEAAKLIRHSDAVAAGTTDVEPAAGIDMTGYSGVLFIVAFGAITASAVTSIKAQQSTASGSGFADLAGTGVTVADTDDDKLFFLEVVNPSERYVRCVVDRGTANAVVDGIVALLFPAAGGMPVVHDSATVGGGELHVSPAEGTA